MTTEAAGNTILRSLDTARAQTRIIAWRAAWYQVVTKMPAKFARLCAMLSRTPKSGNSEQDARAKPTLEPRDPRLVRTPLGTRAVLGLAGGFQQGDSGDPGEQNVDEER
jgi:hypothetical protein